MNEDPFDEKYVGGTESTAAPKEKSAVKEFIKRPVKEEELVRYGTSKPTRIVIRAKLIDGKN